MNYIDRIIIERILKRLKYRKIIAIIGPRQTGKTTLCKKIIPPKLGMDFEYFTFDDPDERLRFSESAISILKNIKKPFIVLDEVQKAPFLFDAIKYVIDNSDNDKKIILTGSSQILIMKKIKETLAGRISLFNLYPFSLREVLLSKDYVGNENLFKSLIEGNYGILYEEESNFNLINSDRIRGIKNITDIHKKYGGLPPVWLIDDEGEKSEWLRDYRKTYIERDLVDVGGFSSLEDLNLVHKLLALRSAQLLNLSNIANEAGISINTVKKYLNILKISFQVSTLSPFFMNAKKRLVKSPKIYFLDTGIIKSILGENSISEGAMYETWFFSELLKLKEIYSPESEIYFYRTGGGAEVDFVLKRGSNIVATEVKLKKNPTLKDGKNLERFLNEYNEYDGIGIIIYPGNRIIKLKEKIWAIPDWFFLAQ